MNRRILPTAAVVLLLLAAAGTAWAQTSPGYDLRWHVISAGGREGMSSGMYQVHGTLGQLAIGPAQAGANSLCAGYWCRLGRAAAETFELFLPALYRITP